MALSKSPLPALFTVDVAQEEVCTQPIHGSVLGTCTWLLSTSENSVFSLEQVAYFFFISPNKLELALLNCLSPSENRPEKPDFSLPKQSSSHSSLNCGSLGNQWQGS